MSTAANLHIPTPNTLTLAVGKEGNPVLNNGDGVDRGLGIVIGLAFIITTILVGRLVFKLSVIVIIQMSIMVLTTVSVISVCTGVLLERVVGPVIAR